MKRYGFVVFLCAATSLGTSACTCNSSEPIIWDDTDKVGLGDAVTSDPSVPQGAAELKVEWEGPTGGVSTDPARAESNFLSTVEVGYLKARVTPAPDYPIHSYQVVFCTESKSKGAFQPTHKILCESKKQTNKCQLAGTVGTGEAELTLYGSDLGIDDGELSRIHTVKVHLLPASALVKSECTFDQPSIREGKVTITVHQDIPPPTAKILPPPGPENTKLALCHSRQNALRAKVFATQDFGSASYCVQWWRKESPGQADTALLGDCVLVVAENGTVCKGTTDDVAGCDLKPGTVNTPKFKKGDKIYVTADLLDIGYGDNGVSTGIRGQSDTIEICNAWPTCTPPQLVAEPGGTGSEWTCKTTCNADLDGDGLQVKMDWINLSTSTQSSTLTPASPLLLDLPEEFSAIQTESPGGWNTGKDEQIVCRISPDDGDLPPDGSIPDTYPYTDDKELAESDSAGGWHLALSPKVTVVNTLPTVRVTVTPITTANESPNVETTFRCEWTVDDIDPLDELFSVQYQWGKSTVGTDEFDPVTTESPKYTYDRQKNPPFSFRLTEYTPYSDPEKDGPKAGNQLCCRVWAAEYRGKSLPLNKTPMATSCVVLGDAPPKIGGSNPFVQVVKSKVQPPLPICFPTDYAPDPTDIYTTDSLTCHAVALLSDPDGADDPAHLRYYWYDCSDQDPEKWKVLGSLLEPATDPTKLKFTKGTKVCCGAKACSGEKDATSDATCIGNEIKASAGVLIADTPPNVGKTPQVAAAETNPGASRNGDFVCTAIPEPQDCDNDKLTVSYLWLAPAFDSAVGVQYTDGNAVNFSQIGIKLACTDTIACQVQVTTDEKKIKSDPSPKFSPTNAPPTVEVTTLSAVGGGNPQVGSTLQCKGTVYDAEADPLTVSVQWFRHEGDNKIEVVPPLGTTTQLTVNPAPGKGAMAAFELKNDPTCAGTSTAIPLFQKGQVISCEITAADGCNKGTATADSLQIGNTPTQILKEACEAVTVQKTPKQGNDDITCTVNTVCLTDCDPGEPTNFKWKYTLYRGQTVVSDSGNDPMDAKAHTFQSNLCDPKTLSQTTTDKFHCKVEAFDALGSTWSADSPEVTVTESKPTATATLTPSNPKVGDTVTCSGNGSDPDPTDTNALTIQTQLTGPNNTPSIPAGATNTISYTLAKGIGGLTCSTTVEDGCFVPTQAEAKVTIGNSPPTFVIDLSPTNPTKAATMTCTAAKFVDPDGDLVKDYAFQWKIADDFQANPKSVACQSTVTTDSANSTAESTLDLSKCSDAAKSKYVICEVTATDNQNMAATLVSKKIPIGDDPPKLSVTIEPKGSLPSKPSLDPGQGLIACAATVTDADVGDIYAPGYQWFVGDSTAVAGMATTFDLATNPIEPCQILTCKGYFTYNGEQVSDSKSLTVWKGGSLRLQGKQSAQVDTNGADAALSAPQQGRVELWMSLFALPDANEQHTVVWGKNASGNSWTWRLQVSNSGVPRLQWKDGDGNITTLISDNTIVSNSPTDHPWRYVGFSYSAFSVWLHHAPETDAGPAKSTTQTFLPTDGSAPFPFDLQRLVFGAGADSDAMNGWIDEVRVSTTTDPGAFPPTPPTVFVSTPQNPALALYHFVEEQQTSAADYGPMNLYHLVWGQTAPTVAHHSLENLCNSKDVLTCASPGTEKCILGPSTVTLSFGKTDGTKPAVDPALGKYWTTCSAQGAMDLATGPITSYDFDWYRKPLNGVGNPEWLAKATGVGSAEAMIEAPVGCYEVWCAATPKVSANSFANLKKESATVKACATKVWLYGFECEDNNPCTANTWDSTGCTHTPIADADKKGLCKLDNCPNGWIAACFPDNQCSCKDPCANTKLDQCHKAVAKDGECELVPVSDIPCNPTAPCIENPKGTCDSGTCKQTASAPKVCNDNNSCTDDSCDPKTGDCSFKPNTALCNDNNACTTGDTCQNAQCAGTTIVCNDNNVCTTDSCVSASGCLFTNNTNTCDDNNLCSQNDGCKNGLCVGTQVVCNDNNPCTFDTCDSGKGCVYTNTTDPCDDGDACTSGEQCANGACVGGAPVVCNDNNPCTTDGCDTKTGCKFDNNTSVCDDKNPCTTQDQCKIGTCVGGPAPICDDKNPCTQNLCDPNKTVGCHYPAVAVDTPCNDGDLCTTGDTCFNGKCLGTGTYDCEDSNACTKDLCAEGACNYANVADKTLCDDGSACTTADQCTAGLCKGQGGDCNDNNPCTVDQCLVQGCANTQKPVGTACDDGIPCTTGDQCTAAGVCTGAAKVCNDNNVCTADSCNAADGECINTPIGTPAQPATCDDNNACTTGDVCSNGQCAGKDFLPPECDDGNVCTDDGCKSLGNNQFECTATNNTKSCDDDSFCTKTDQCKDGQCVGQNPVVCPSDNNPCTDDVCIAKSGLCASFANSISCNDGNACTTGDQCGGGTCKGGEPQDCDDKNVCTTDACDPKTGCTHVPSDAAKNCPDNNPCTTDQCDETKGCQHIPCTTCTCTDNDACTTEQCQSGVCTKTATKSCDDNNECTTDWCNPVDGKCSNPPALGSIPCEDGDNCSTGDYCSGGTCSSGSDNSECSDTDLCTVDKCNADGTCVTPKDQVNSYCCNTGADQNADKCCKNGTKDPCLRTGLVGPFAQVPWDPWAQKTICQTTQLTGFFKDLCMPTGTATQYEVCWTLFTGTGSASLRTINDIDFQVPSSCPAVAPISQCTKLPAPGFGNAEWTVLSFDTSQINSNATYVVRPVPTAINCKSPQLALSEYETATCTTASFTTASTAEKAGCGTAECNVPKGSQTLVFVLNKVSTSSTSFLDIWVSGIPSADTKIYLAPKTTGVACTATPPTQTQTCTCKVGASFWQTTPALTDRCVWVVSTKALPANAAVTVGAYRYTCGN